jgi:hypothetical protein
MSGEQVRDRVPAHRSVHLRTIWKAVIQGRDCDGAALKISNPLGNRSATDRESGSHMAKLAQCFHATALVLSVTAPLCNYCKRSLKTI